MPMKKGHSQEVVSGNIKELVRSGRKPKEAIAIALAHARKYKKMAEGGMVQDDDSSKDKQPIASPDNPVVKSVRKAFGYAEGGMVEDDEKDEGDVNAGSDMGDAGEPINPMGEDEEGLSENVMDAESLYAALQSKKYAANDNSSDFDANDMVSGKKMSRSGETEDGDGMMGAKPDLGWIGEGSEESMSSMPEKKENLDHALESRPILMGLSEEAKSALRKKKMNRRYGQYNPS